MLSLFITLCYFLPFLALSMLSQIIEVYLEKLMKHGKWCYHQCVITVWPGSQIHPQIAWKTDPRFPASPLAAHPSISNLFKSSEWPPLPSLLSVSSLPVAEYLLNTCQPGIGDARYTCDSSFAGSLHSHTDYVPFIRKDSYTRWWSFRGDEDKSWEIGYDGHAFCAGGWGNASCHLSTVGKGWGEQSMPSPRSG